MSFLEDVSTEALFAELADRVEFAEACARSAAPLIDVSIFGMNTITPVWKTVHTASEGSVFTWEFGPGELPVVRRIVIGVRA